MSNRVTENPSCDHDAIPPSPVCSTEVLERAAAILRAAGEPGRLRLLELLAPGERCVTELAELSGTSLPTVSARLRVLRGERLLSRRREGKHQFYALADRHVAELVQGVLEHAAEEP
ncbi:MAG: metalloregulator ArsR/SmtB family transcription factor [Planctomycetota bacterium]